jgi:hypothetical protein
MHQRAVRQEKLEIVAAVCDRRKLFPGGRMPRPVHFVRCAASRRYAPGSPFFSYGASLPSPQYGHNNDKHFRPEQFEDN